ncbi:MAG: hypothetical protein V2I97_16700 [Desulfococcaceae bacterium]|jgi:hypothetical protein|nr:hypothetical protein [Desulfococcaceae bacterium]
MRIETRGYGGSRISRKVSFHTNDPQTARLELSLSGNVIRQKESRSEKECP